MPIDQPITPPDPILIFIAGPNGSGKTTITNSLGFRNRMPVLDPDEIARRLNPGDPSAAAIAAGREVLERWQKFVAQRLSFATETTLAGAGPLSRLREARAAGYRIEAWYVAVDTPELNLERVRHRVRRGGHDIPEADLRRRHRRSLDNAIELLRLADSAFVVDNSEQDAVTVLEFESGRLIWRAAELPAWAEEILRTLLS